MMKYFALLALFASLALVRAAPTETIGESDDPLEGETISNVGFMPEESDNVANLIGNQALFVPFCNEARDLVENKIINERDNLKSTMFNVIFTSAENMAHEMLNSEHFAKEMLTQQLRDPTESVKTSENPDEITQIVEEGANSIHQGTNRNDLLASVNTILKVLFTRSRQVLEDHATKVKEFLNAESLQLVNEGCSRFTKEYLQVVNNKFRQHKSKLLEAAKEEGNQQVINAVQSQGLEPLQCGITKRLLRAQQFCQFYQATSPIFIPMLQRGN